jgi:hypothetical protein
LEPLASAGSDENRERRRILSAETVSASWQAFERSCSDGTFRRIFERDELLISANPEELAAFAKPWLARQV